METSKAHNAPTPKLSESEFQMDFSDLQNSCRVCMRKEQNMNSIFNGNKNIRDMIIFCSGIEIFPGDGLPSKICSPCLANLAIAHKFKTSCLFSNETFRKLVVEIKIEPKVSTDTDGYQNDDHFDDDDDDDGEVDSKDNVMKILREKPNKDIGATKPEDENETKQDSENCKPRKKRQYNKPMVKSKVGRKKMKKSRLFCEICQMRFENKEECLKHNQEAHSDSMNFVCEVCGKFFVHRSSHYSHLRSHLPPQFSCTYCDYRTWHKHDLTKHTRIHTGLKLYQCEICSASYYTSSNLASHIKRLHMKVIKYHCQHCDRGFFDRTKLNIHLDTHNDIKRFECEVCNSCFTRRCHLKKHLLKQHGVSTPPMRPGRQKTNYLIGELSQKIEHKVVTDSSNNKEKETKQAS